MSTKDKWPKDIKSYLAKYSKGGLIYKPGDPLPTHPDNQPYVKPVKANLKQKSRKDKIVAWNDETGDPLKLIPAVNLPDPILRKNTSTMVQLSAKTEAELKKIFKTRS